MTKARRTGTYVAFDGGGTTNPTQSDIKYYNLMKAWKSSTDEFHFLNSHEKSQQVKDTSSPKTLQAALTYRLLRSKNFVLILTGDSPWSAGWLKWEIEYAIYKCDIPIICVYPGSGRIRSVESLRKLWPACLISAVDAELVRSIHIPFLQAPLLTALRSFTPASPPSYPVSVYGIPAYDNWGID